MFKSRCTRVDMSLHLRPPLVPRADEPTARWNPWLTSSLRVVGQSRMLLICVNCSMKEFRRCRSDGRTSVEIVLHVAFLVAPTDPQRKQSEQRRSDPKVRPFRGWDGTLSSMKQWRRFPINRSRAVGRDHPSSTLSHWCTGCVWQRRHVERIAKEASLRGRVGVARSCPRVRARVAVGCPTKEFPCGVSKHLHAVRPQTPGGAPTFEGAVGRHRRIRVGRGGHQLRSGTSARLDFESPQFRQIVSADGERWESEGHRDGSFSSPPHDRDSGEAICEGVRERVRSIPMCTLDQGGNRMRWAFVASRHRKPRCHGFERGWNLDVRPCPAGGTIEPSGEDAGNKSIFLLCCCPVPKRQHTIGTTTRGIGGPWYKLKAGNKATLCCR